MNFARKQFLLINISPSSVSVPLQHDQNQILILGTQVIPDYLYIAIDTSSEVSNAQLSYDIFIETYEHENLRRLVLIIEHIFQLFLRASYADLSSICSITCSN